MDSVIERINEFWMWVQQVVLSTETLVQVVFLLLIGGVVHFCLKSLGNAGERLAEKNKFFARTEPHIRPLYRPIIILILLFIARLTTELLVLPGGLFQIAMSLVTAWIVIRLFTSFISNSWLSRAVALFVWLVAALNIFGLLTPLVEILKAASIDFGTATISAYDVIWGLITFIALIWFSLFLSRIVEAQLKSVRGINPSIKVLIGKVTKISFVSLAFLLALNTTGIDLTALAVFGGALGVGIGFGMQKVVSNFISGVILLMDRSIKPGDVIQIQDTYGSVNKLAARYTSVITRDGTEYLIPNEDMITQPVINWSHTNRVVRRRISLNVSYKTDLDLARKIMINAAKNHERTLDEMDPRALIKGFGDNGVELELRFWINDPQNGVANINSDVMSVIWTKFHEAGIEFPYPQRVVHIVNDEPQKAPKKLARKKK